MAPGQVATEDMDVPPSFPFPRVSEQAALALRGVNTSVIRLPQVHNPSSKDLLPISLRWRARKACQPLWEKDAIAGPRGMFRKPLAFTGWPWRKGEPGAKYHSVREEGVSMRDIAEAIGRGLEVPVKSLSPDEAQDHFGRLAMFAGLDRPASSAQTQEQLRWHPTGPDLIVDLEQMRYVKAETFRRAK